MDPTKRVKCELSRDGVPAAHLVGCVVCTVAQRFRAENSDAKRLEGQGSALVRASTTQCGRCKHPVQVHDLTHLTVGDCGLSKAPHPEVVWKMVCQGMLAAASGALPCGCNDFVMQGGRPPGAGHPG